MVINRDIFTQWSTTRQQKMTTHIIGRINTKGNRKDLMPYNVIYGKLKKHSDHIRSDRRQNNGEHKRAGS